MFSVFQSVCRSRGPRAGSFRASRLILLDPRLRTAPDSGRRGRVADVRRVVTATVPQPQPLARTSRVRRSDGVRRVSSSVYSKTSRQLSKTCQQAAYTWRGGFPPWGSQAYKACTVFMVKPPASAPPAALNQSVRGRAVDLSFLIL